MTYGDPLIMKITGAVKAFVQAFSSGRSYWIRSYSASPFKADLCRRHAKLLPHLPSSYCPTWCCVIHLRSFNVSVPNAKKRVSKHAIQEKDLTFENKRKQVPVVSIWKNMTVADLARSMKKSTGWLKLLLIFYVDANN
jgi:hypothetical protein